MSAILQNKWLVAILALALIAIGSFMVFDYNEALEDVSDYGEDILDNIFDGVEGASNYLRQLVSGMGEVIWVQIRSVQVGITNMLIGGINACIQTIDDLLPGNPITQLPYMDFY